MVYILHSTTTIFFLNYMRNGDLLQGVFFLFFLLTYEHKINVCIMLK